MRSIATMFLAAAALFAASNVHATEPQHVFNFGSSGTGDGQFQRPLYITVDDSSNAYVLDYDLDRISKFDSGGNFAKVWGGTGSGPGQFNEPQDLAFGDGLLYVTDGVNDRVQIFDHNGIYQTEFALDNPTPEKNEDDGFKFTLLE